MSLKNFCHVNRKLLPFKLHFFFLCGGMAGVLPFLTLIAMQIGINATALGIGYSLVPFFVFLSNPIFGLLVDYFQNIKPFIIAVLSVSSVSVFCIIFIPAIKSATAQINITNLNTSYSTLELPMIFEKVCLENMLDKDINCSLIPYNNTFCNSLNYTSSIPVYYEHTLGEVRYESINATYWVAFSILDKIETECIVNTHITFHCFPNLNPCLARENSSVFYTHQYWVYFLLHIISSITGASSNTLSFAATLEALDKNIEAYGKQRLFGTISWGLISLAAGLLNDTFGYGGNSFAPGFYILAVFCLVDIVIVGFTPIPKANYSTNMCSDLVKILTSVEIVFFAFGVIVTGVLAHVIAMYEFLFLHDMGASQFLLGLAITMQCLVGEIPFLYFSGWILKKIGPFLCLVTVFAAFALRMGLYSILSNPWYVLPIDVLHGVTFGVYHGAMASYSRTESPKGMETTLLSMFEGLYGLGCGLGSFLGGTGFDYFGPRRLFSSGSILSGCTCFLFLLASFCFRKESQERKLATPLKSLETKETYRTIEE